MLASHTTTQVRADGTALQCAGKEQCTNSIYAGLYMLYVQPVYAATLLVQEAVDPQQLQAQR
jgi:hypothetical protein